MRTRDEITAEIKALKESDKNSLWYTVGAMAKDLSPFIDDNETILCALDGSKKGIVSFWKGGRAFRTYIIATNKRLIYIERGQMAFNLIPFFKKTKIIPYEYITGITIRKLPYIWLRLFYSREVIFEAENKKFYFRSIGGDIAASFVDITKKQIDKMKIEA